MSASAYQLRESTANEINDAAERSHAAFLLYRLCKAREKIAFLELIADTIDKERFPLNEVASRETLLPRTRLEVEINRTVHQLRLFSELLKDGSWARAIIEYADTSRKPAPKPDLRQMQHPIGPVAVFGASNFPFAYSVCGGDTVAALAAGCTVVYKANPGHPQTSEQVARIVIQAAKETGVPDGTFSMVQGISNEIGIKLVTHPLIKAVGFTGSLKGGRAIYNACANRDEPIPTYAEMGSTNPVFILPEILEQRGEELAHILATSNTSSVGQFCTNPGIMVAHDSLRLDSFYNAFAKAIADTPSAPMLTQAIHNSFEKSMKQLMAKTQLTVGAIASDETQDNARAHMFISSAENFLSDTNLWEEMFGPSSIQVTARDVSEMMKIAESLPGQLTATIWGTENDLKSNVAFVRLLELKAGRLIINGVPTGVEVSAAMNHGGPYPATTDSKFTSVGTQSIYRFTRPVCYQNFPEYLLPDELRH